MAERGGRHREERHRSERRSRAQAANDAGKDARPRPRGSSGTAAAAWCWRADPHYWQSGKPAVKQAEPIVVGEDNSRVLQLRLAKDAGTLYRFRSKLIRQVGYTRLLCSTKPSKAGGVGIRAVWSSAQTPRWSPPACHAACAPTARCSAARARHSVPPGRVSPASDAGPGDAHASHVLLDLSARHLGLPTGCGGDGACVRRCSVRHCPPGRASHPFGQGRTERPARRAAPGRPTSPCGSASAILCPSLSVIHF